MDEMYDITNTNAKAHDDAEKEIKDILQGLVYRLMLGPI